MNNIFLLLLVATNIVFIGCKTDSGEKTIREDKPGESKISDIIRNPVSAEGDIDTVNVPKMTFVNEVYNFGEVVEGEMVTVEFSFTNTGKVPLLIVDGRSTCGCTVPQWPKEPIDPGQGGVIVVEFNTEGRKYDQKRPVSIIANTYPRQTDIFVQGHVIPKN